MDIFKARCSSFNDASSFILTSRVSEPPGDSGLVHANLQRNNCCCVLSRAQLCTKGLFHTELLCPMSLQPASLGVGTHTAPGPQCCLCFRAKANPSQGRGFGGDGAALGLGSVGRARQRSQAGARPWDGWYCRLSRRERVPHVCQPLCDHCLGLGGC